MKVNEEFLDVIGHMVSHINMQERRIAELERAFVAKEENFSTTLSLIEKLAKRLLVVEDLIVPTVERVTQVGETLAEVAEESKMNLINFSSLVSAELERLDSVSISHNTQILECKDRLDYISTKPYNKSLWRI